MTTFLEDVTVYTMKLFNAAVCAAQISMRWKLETVKALMKKCARFSGFT
jgi:hypothetical protein